MDRLVELGGGEWLQLSIETPSPEPIPGDRPDRHDSDDHHAPATKDKPVKSARG